MIDDARQPPDVDTRLLFQLGAAGKENQLFVQKPRLSRFVDVVKQRVAGGIDVVRQRLGGDGNVLDARGGTGGFGKIRGLTRPKYILLTVQNVLHVGFQILIVADGNGVFELVVSFYFLKKMILAESRGGSFAYQLLAPGGLRGGAVGHPAALFFDDVVGQRSAKQCSDSHS